VDHIDLAGKAAQKESFLGSSIAAADNGNRYIAEERAIAGCAVGNTPSGELGFVGDSQFLRFGAGGDDHRSGPNLLAVHSDNLDFALVNQAFDFACDHLEAKLLTVFLKADHQVGSVDPARKPGIILYLGGGHDLAAQDHAFDQQGFQLGARCIEPGSQSGRAAANDQYVIKCFRHCPTSVKNHQ
jgi:hypothetical protein